MDAGVTAVLRPVPTYGASASELTPQDRLIRELRQRIKELEAVVKEQRDELRARERKYREIRRRVFGELITHKGRQYELPTAPLVDGHLPGVVPVSAKEADKERLQRLAARGGKIGRPTDDEIRRGLGTDRKLHGENHG